MKEPQNAACNKQEVPTLKLVTMFSVKRSLNVFLLWSNVHYIHYLTELQSAAEQAHPFLREIAQWGGVRIRAACLAFGASAFWMVVAFNMFLCQTNNMVLKIIWMFVLWCLVAWLFVWLLPSYDLLVLQLAALKSPGWSSTKKRPPLWKRNFQVQMSWSRSNAPKSYRTLVFVEEFVVFSFLKVSEAHPKPLEASHSVSQVPGVFQVGGCLAEAQGSLLQLVGVGFEEGAAPVA